ncbi:hypothetical protein [Shewanella baltica]|uniref:hypothetical protein n=1 Tax=Shewanella baltica TaxID=62322 RepID=UPI00217F1719|nr:hypothetical protein [Shewanella baltica]MCS6210413.1 hypothetical protein [Shewanella baltica]
MSAPSSKKPRDQRPKVISFPTALHGLNITARQSVLWPCHAFNISIPQKKKSALNVFEQTILKITEIESGDTIKIAETTCIDKEIVAFIQNRLNQFGLLNDHYELSEEGKKLLESSCNKEEATVEYVSGTVFVDLHSGKLLPYIHMGNLKQEKILSIDSSYTTVELGSTGKSRSVRCRLISPDAGSQWNVKPASNEIIRAIREFKKKFKRYSLLNQGVDQSPPPVPIAEAISIHDNPELVYLHCNVLIQIGNSDLLVTDGCGFGFSESFANYLNSKNLDWVTKLKLKGIVDKIGNAEGSENQRSRKSFKYAEISSRIVRSTSALEKIKNLKVNSTYYESDNRQEIENGIKSLYAALEWSLRQVVCENRCSEWEDIFSGNNFRDNERLLIGFAKKNGFSVNEKNQSLLQVKAGAIRQIENGNAELQPLLALGIAGASINANHPIHRLALNHSSFLNHALKLKKYRDPIEHGSAETLNIGKDDLEELIDTTVPMIISLVPGVADDLGEAYKIAIDEDINQERLKANIELETVLGTKFVSNLSSDIKEQLIRSELMLAQFTDDKTIEIIKCFASVMQHALFDAVKDRRLEIVIDTLRETAIEKIVQSGFYPAPDDIPEQIRTINIKRLYRAVQGSSTTLGTQLLTVFLLGSESELVQFKRSDPTFIGFIANLIKLRGHGNKQQADFSRVDMESLKNNTIKAIKTIKDIF